MINTMFEYDENKKAYKVTCAGALVGELYMEADGFYVFDPIVGRTGYWPAWMLRVIADKLEELNKEWTATVMADLMALDAEPLDEPEVLK